MRSTIRSPRLRAMPRRSCAASVTNPRWARTARLDVFQKYLEVIVREAYHCKGIIGSLLNFGRKSDGLIGTVNLNALLMEILELLRHQPNYGEMEVVADLKENIPLHPR